MKFLGVFCMLIIAFWLGYNKGKEEIILIENTEQATKLYKEIDSLNNIIGSISNQIDSLQYVIDTSEKVVYKISMAYEEKYLDLCSAPIFKQLEFFSDYLSKDN